MDFELVDYSSDLTGSSLKASLCSFDRDQDVLFVAHYAE